MIITEAVVQIKRTVNTGNYENVVFDVTLTAALNADDTMNLHEVMAGLWDTAQRNIKAQTAPFTGAKRAEAEAIILGLPENLRAGLLAQLEATLGD